MNPPCAPVLTAMSMFRARSEASFGLLVIPSIFCFKTVSAAATTSDVLRPPMQRGRRGKESVRPETQQQSMAQRIVPVVLGQQLAGAEA